MAACDFRSANSLINDANLQGAQHVWLSSTCTRSGDADLGQAKAAGRPPFRVVTGHGAYVMPFIRKVRFLTLAMCEAEVKETCVTQQGISLNVRAVIAFKVGNDAESIVNAGQRFLSDQSQMSVLTGRIFAGHLRSIIGSMTVEQIIKERQKLASEVLDGSKEEMVKIGLTVDALQIQSIDDGKLGYITAMSAPHNTAIQQRGPDRSSTSESGRRQSPARIPAEPGGIRPPDRNSAGEVHGRSRPGAGGMAAQAGPLAKAKAQREVIAARKPSWPSGLPSCVSNSWSPRWCGRPKRTPSGCGSSRRPTPRRCVSKLRPPRLTIA